MSRQLATSSENLVASPQFLVALATSESQFQALTLDLAFSLKLPHHMTSSLPVADVKPVNTPSLVVVAFILVN